MFPVGRLQRASAHSVYIGLRSGKRDALGNATTHHDGLVDIRGTQTPPSLHHFASCRASQSTTLAGSWNAEESVPCRNAEKPLPLSTIIDSK